MAKRCDQTSRTYPTSGDHPVAEASAGDVGTDGPAARPPALLVLVRALARQAAAEMFRASITAAAKHQENL